MDCMNKHNLILWKEFILLGITGPPELQAPLFGLFLTVYLVSVVGNLSLIILTKIDSGLQTPMYFFLRHLALTDLGYSTAIDPKCEFYCGSKYNLLLFLQHMGAFHIIYGHC